MDGPADPGDPAGAGGAVAPALAFFGLWPRIADARAEAPRLVAVSPAGTGTPAAGVMDGSGRPG
jgi:hypothetical protein